jgi:hypothetical protein
MKLTFSSYVHGVMDGEIVDQLRLGRVRTEELVFNQDLRQTPLI